MGVCAGAGYTAAINEATYEGLGMVSMVNIGQMFSNDFTGTLNRPIQRSCNREPNRGQAKDPIKKEDAPNADLEEAWARAQYPTAHSM